MMMPTVMMIMKADIQPYEKLKFFDAWDEWNIPLAQQRIWLRDLLWDIAFFEKYRSYLYSTPSKHNE